MFKSKFAFVFIVVILFAINLSAQNSPQQKSPLDATRWGVVYDVPATKDVKLKADVPYLKDSKGTLAIDIYTPPNMKAGEKLPAVVFLNAIGDRPDDKVKNWEIYKSFPRLVAAHGLIGISMDADGERIQECLRSLFDFLAKEGDKHGIDGNRLGVYAASANVTQSSVYLMSENVSKGIKAAALYYGGVPAGRYRKDLPVLFIIAEGDMPRLRPDMPALWQRILENNAPWTLQVASNLPHAFDAFSDNDESRRIIQQTIAFWKSNLETPLQPDWKPSEARAIVAALYGSDAQKSADLLQKYIAANPNDGDAYFHYGRMLSQLRRYDDAGTAFEKTLALGVSHGGVYYSLGLTRMSQQRWEDAEKFLTKALEIGARTSLIYGQLAYSQLHLNRNEEAIKNYEKAFEAGIPPGANTRGLAYYNMACAYARLKQNDKAFDMLSKAVDEGFNRRSDYESDTDFEPLRADARFQKLLERLPKNTN